MRPSAFAPARALLPALALWAGAAQAQTPAPQTVAAQPPGAAPVSLQQQFNTASQAEQAEDCATALPLFAALAKDPRVKPGSLPAAAIALRQGHCLVAQHRTEEGEALIEAGLPAMRQAGADFSGDVVSAELDLAHIATWRHEEAPAVAHYQAALGLLAGDQRVGVLLQLAVLTAFDGDGRALALTQEALTIATVAAKPDKKVLAYIHDVHGRILLNQGEVKPAYAELKQALALAGGLTDHATYNDVELRGDLAQAALLNGDQAGARLYLAYTGAGHIMESPFHTAAAMQAPDCGGETGLQPDDTAIVDFAIRSDGSVTGAQTVYTRGNYAVAAAFAKAVEAWFWRPEDLAKIPPFYRQLTRVEMRCSNSGGNLPGILTPLTRRYVGWAVAAAPSLPDNVASAALQLPALNDQGHAAMARGALAEGAATLGLRAIADPRVGPVQLRAFDEALAAARQAHAPPEAINALVVAQMARQVAHARKGARPVGLADWAGFLPLADQAPLADDPLAADTLRLLAVPNKPDAAHRAAARALAGQVADDQRLAPHAPLRQAALLWLANDAARAGLLDEAQGYFQRTGLDSEQCALIGPKPAMRASGASSSDYPDEALRMGFEGWVKLEYNINADGTTAAPRALISYPPFIFDQAATTMARSIRYERSFRPGGGEACKAEQQNINFTMGLRH